MIATITKIKPILHSTWWQKQALWSLVPLLTLSLFSTVNAANPVAEIVLDTLKPCTDINQQSHCVIAYFNHDEVGTKEESYSYRVLLNKDANNHYLVQDFYSEYPAKLSDPFTLINVNDLQKTVNDFTLLDISIDGTYREWYNDGQLALEYHYEQGKPVGVWQRWFGNGQRLSEEHKSGNLAGNESWWYINGSPRNTTVRLSKPNDPEQRTLFTQWYENGQKKSEGIFIDGDQDGVWHYWYDNGQLKETSQYQRDRIIGTPEWWDQQGYKLTEKPSN